MGNGRFCHDFKDREDRLKWERVAPPVGFPWARFENEVLGKCMIDFANEIKKSGYWPGGPPERLERGAGQSSCYLGRFTVPAGGGHTKEVSVRLEAYIGAADQVQVTAEVHDVKRGASCRASVIEAAATRVAAEAEARTRVTAILAEALKICLSHR